MCNFSGHWKVAGDKIPVKRSGRSLLSQARRPKFPQVTDNSANIKFRIVFSPTFPQVTNTSAKIRFRVLFSVKFPQVTDKSAKFEFPIVDSPRPLVSDVVFCRILSTRSANPHHFLWFVFSSRTFLVFASGTYPA